MEEYEYGYDDEDYYGWDDSFVEGWDWYDQD